MEDSRSRPQAIHAADVAVAGSGDVHCRPKAALRCRTIDVCVATRCQMVGGFVCRRCRASSHTLFPLSQADVLCRPMRAYFPPDKVAA